MTQTRRVFIGPDPNTGESKFRVSLPGIDALNCPTKDLIFGENFYGRRPWMQGSLDIPQATGPFPAPAYSAPWMNTINFGKTFVNPPDIEFFRYYNRSTEGQENSVSLPMLTLAYNTGFQSGMSVYYVVRNSYMRVGIMYGNSTEVPFTQDTHYSSYHGVALQSGEKYHKGYLGKIGWIIWDEI